MGGCPQVFPIYKLGAGPLGNASGKANGNMCYPAQTQLSIGAGAVTEQAGPGGTPWATWAYGLAG